MNPSLKHIANGLGIVLLIALVAPFVVYAVPGVVGAEHSFVVLTASMTPAIAPGDVVIVDERDPSAIADGDVITFVRGGNEVPVTHRVVDVVDGPNGVAFETQGDANDGPDAALVPGESVLGAVAVTIPYIGYVIQFTNSPLGFAALVVVPFGLLLLSELWSFARTRERASPSGDGSVPEPADENDAAASTAQTAPTGSEPTGVTVDTVVGAGVVLAAFAPYSAYVALQFRTALAVTVAVATAGLSLAALAMWLSATGFFARVGPTADAADTDTETVDAADTTDADATASDGADSHDSSDDPPLAADGAGEVD